MDLLIIAGLILLNGLFSMSEIAVVSSRKVRLQRFADEGRRSAAAALALHTAPANFLSTIQVGITLIGVLSGAVGERAFVEPLTVRLAEHAGWRPTRRSSPRPRGRGDHLLLGRRRRTACPSGSGCCAPRASPSWSRR